MKEILLEDEKVIIYKQDDIEYLQFKRLLEYPNLIHAYTLKSKGELNFLPEYQDSEMLEKSKQKICKALGLQKQNIVKPHQTHTNIVKKVTKSIEKFNEVDGLITNETDIALCTTSADCTTFLLYDPVKDVIGNVHSGWRGTVQKIGQNAIQKMIKTYASNPKDIICCICPHIRKCHFEVEEDVMELFKKEFQNLSLAEGIIEKGQIIGGKQKYYINTTKINIELLKQAGLKQENIIDSGICTVCNESQFHSYRAHKQQSGRNAGIICHIGDRSKK